ncbi:unnamed protein product [Schistosoma curassoni]|uniref:Craniofacial development protein 2-like n=1 Tax=Schistosoma curassoni TaxID=6186 RepID=A0A183KZD2_9TREM|nr:unnamed protein product [Schistosoma curassoni]
MWETGRTTRLATEMRRYNLAVLGINETHWTLTGQQNLDLGEMLLYSGYEEKKPPHTQGVALMFKKAWNSLIVREYRGSGISKASLKTKREEITINVIQCYTPTNDSDEDNEDHVYERMQSIIAKCSMKDLTILIRDLNAKVGIDNTGYKNIMR